jgi:thiopeptide-type bacteriocin biosynthesis protein
MTSETVERRRRRARDSEALYEPLDGVLVRAPLLPVAAYLALAPEVGGTAGAPPSLADPLVRSAVAVGSPDLLAQIERGSAGQDAQRTMGKLLRYVIRMSTRPTPYGLFAGVALAGLGGATDLRIDAGPPRTRMRPDMAWLLALVAQLEERPEVRRELRVMANPAILMHGGRACVAERATVDGGGDPAPVGIRATGAVRRALALARAPIEWKRLAEALLATAGATEEKVDGLLTQLWQQTFLLTELRPPLTHPAPARYVAERLSAVPSAAPERAALVELLESMTAWDELVLDERPAADHALGRLAAAAVPGHTGAYAQVDTSLALAGTHIGAPVARAAARAAELLLRLSPPLGAGQLEGYRTAFLNRYGSDREVALLELLDPERGLGPPSGHGSAQIGGDAGRFALRQATLRAIAIEAVRDRRLAVELDEATVAKLELSRPTTATAPVSLDLAVFVLAGSAADIDSGDFRLLIGPNLGAQAAGRNLGRFADLLGGQAEDALAAVAAAEIESSPGDLHAELVYLPRRGRSANVTIRPRAYEHEVVVGTMPAVDPQRAIPLAELLVGVREGRFYVRWPRARGLLRVHAGHMLNSYGAPAACRFLEEVARDERMMISSFDWGPAAELPVLPRIEVDRIVLSPAQWRIDTAARDAHLDPDDGSFHERLAEWRTAWMVPHHVYLSVADNRLLLDLDALAQAEQLRQELRRLPDGGALVLQEPLPGPEHAWLEGPEGRHLCELVFPLVQRTAEPSVAAEPATLARAAVVAPGPRERVRPPGSEWLYMKLYGPRDGEDELLAGALRDFGHFAANSGLAERWFFVRYADPEPHLRVRFGGNPERLLGDLLPRVCVMTNELIAEGSCLRVSFDTYDREIERYGGLAAMDAAEAIFATDSGAVVDMLQLARGDLPTMDRTTLAVLSVDALLDALGLDAAGRLAWYHEQVAAKHESGDDYRQRQRTLRYLLDDPDSGADEPGGPALVRVLHARRAALAPLGDQLRALERDGTLTKPLDRIYESYIHLHCNRLLGAGPPTEQRVLGLLLRTREGLSRAPRQRESQ